MKKENENINEEDSEDLHDDGSWLENVEEDIEDEIEHMDTDFPLSGGDESEPAKVPDRKKGKKNDEKKTSFSEDLDDEFPLSGGEVDR